MTPGRIATLALCTTLAPVGVVRAQLGVVILTNQWDANPLRIGLGVAGLIDSELVPAHRLTSQVDRDPGTTERVRGFVAALFGGGDFSPYVTPGLARHLAAMPRPPAGKGPSPVPAFVAAEDLIRRVERYGSAVARLAHYVVTIDGANRYLTFYVAADARVADFTGY